MLKRVALAAALALTPSAFAADQTKDGSGIDFEAIKRITKEFQDEKAGCATDWKVCTDATLTNSWGRRGSARQACVRVLKSASTFGEPGLPSLPFRHAVFTDATKAKGFAIFYEPDAIIPNGTGGKVKTSIGCKVNLDTLEVLKLGPWSPNG